MIYKYFASCFFTSTERTFNGFCNRIVFLDNDVESERELEAITQQLKKHVKEKYEVEADIVLLNYKLLDMQ